MTLQLECTQLEGGVKRKGRVVGVFTNPLLNVVARSVHNLLDGSHIEEGEPDVGQLHLVFGPREEGVLFDEFPNRGDIFARRVFVDLVVEAEDGVLEVGD